MKKLKTVKNEKSDLALSQKFKFFAIPFVLCVVGASTGTVLLRWLFFYQTHFLRFNTSIWNWWIPFGVATLLWLIYFRKRINLVVNPNWKGNGDTLFHLAIIGFLAGTIVNAQFLLEDSQYKVVSIHSINEIKLSNWENCYSIENSINDNVFWDVNETHSFYYSETTGKNNQTLNYDAYFVAPFIDWQNKDTLCWIGKKYEKSMSNSVSDFEKEDEWRIFTKSCMENFPVLVKQKSEYLYPVGLNGDFQKYVQAIERTDRNKGLKHRVFELSSISLKSEVQRMGVLFLIMFSLGLASCLVIASFRIVNMQAYKDYIDGKLRITSDEKDIRDFLLLKRNNKVAAILIYLMVMLYIITAIKYGDLITIGSDPLKGVMNNSEAVGNGEWWRLLTNIFFHYNLMHIINNIILFILLAIFIEPVLGGLKFLTLFIVGGLIASLVSNYYEPNSFSVGASGAVYALFAWYFFSCFYYKSMRDSQGIALLIGGLLLLSTLFSFMMSNVAHYAHLGGFLGGLALAFVLRPQVQKNN